MFSPNVAILSQSTTTPEQFKGQVRYVCTGKRCVRGDCSDQAREEWGQTGQFKKPFEFMSLLNSGVASSVVLLRLAEEAGVPTAT